MREELTISGQAEASLPRRDYTLALLQHAIETGSIPVPRLTALRDALHQAAAERAMAFTKGKSTTVSRAQAESFYTSVLCQLDAVLLELPSDKEAEAMLRDAEIPTLLTAGQCRILQLYEAAKSDFRRAYQLMQPFMILTFSNMLPEFAAFCTRYDARFFAHDVHISYGYPLAFQPEPPEEAGVMGAAKYYHGLLLEGEFLARFDGESLHAMLRHYANKYLTAPENIAENLAELALAHMMVCMLCGEPAYTLSVTEMMLTQLADLWQYQTLDTTRTKITELLASCDLSEAEMTYLSALLPSLTEVLDSRMQAGNLAGWLVVS